MIVSRTIVSRIIVFLVKVLECVVVETSLCYMRYANLDPVVHHTSNTKYSGGIHKKNPQ